VATRPTPQPVPFRFAVYGDCRRHHPRHRAIVQRILQLDPAFVLNVGDLVQNGGEPQQWQTLDQIIAPLRDHAPYYPVRGNHDVGGNHYEAFFDLPTESGSERYYAFTHGNSLFLALDSNADTLRQPDSPQSRWLERTLREAQAEHIFVFFHHPPFSIGPHGGDEDLRARWHPLFVEFGVRAVFNGHDHLYYRTCREGVWYVVTGGGGAPLYRAHPERGAIQGDVWGSFYHCVSVTVKGPTVAAQAILPGGEVKDSWVLSDAHSADPQSPGRPPPSAAR